MEPIFEVTGRVVDAESIPCPGLQVAIVDWDPIRDDLIAWGTTRGNGQFGACFTCAEFNQDLFERERLPDLYVVFSETRGEEFVAVHREMPAPVRFEGGRADLGVFRLPARREFLPALPKVSPTPGLKAGLARLRVDLELVRRAIADVVPRVEELTGFRGLSSGYEVELASGLRGVFARWAASSGIERDMVCGVLLDFVLAENVAAFYDPAHAILTVNRGLLARRSYDALRVALAHELVHVGQFREHPALAKAYGRGLASLVPAVVADGGTLEAFRDRLAESGLEDLLRNLEGYATYIQQDFLEKELGSPGHFPYLSLRTMALRGIISRHLSALAGDFAARLADLGSGADAYRRLQKGARPAPFHP